MVETSGMVLRTFYRVPKHISRSNQKFQNQLPTTDPTILVGGSGDYLLYKKQYTPFERDHLDGKSLIIMYHQTFVLLDQGDPFQEG